MTNYLRTFIKDKNVASVVPTSEGVIKSVCEPIDFSKDLVIIEYGPGNGVFTEYLLKKMSPGSSVILIETNEDFVKHLRTVRDERVSVYQDSAEHVGQIMEKAGVEKADIIISGIPFSFLKAGVKDNILMESRKLLKDDGIFLAYQTSRHLEKPLKKHFCEVTMTFRYMNIPPMCLYKASGFSMKKD